MRIACAQMDVLLGEPEKNLAHALELVRKAAAYSPDAVLIPETWNTGFFPKEGLAEIEFPYLPAFDGIMLPEDSEEDGVSAAMPEAAKPKLTREDKAHSGE